MFVQRRARRFGIFVLVGIVSFFLLAFFMSGLRRSNPNVDPLYFLFVLLLLAITATSVLFISTRVLNSWFLKLQFRKQIAASPALQEPREIEFNEVGMEGSTFFGEGITKWQAFIQVLETDTDFHFFTAPKAALFVPKAAFEDDADIERLRHLIVERVGNRARLT